MVIYSVPKEANQVHANEIASRADEVANLRAVMHLSDEAGYIDDEYLREALERPLPDYVWMLCGPDAMTDSNRSEPQASAGRGLCSGAADARRRSRRLAP